jgi:hypothetical protein
MFAQSRLPILSRFLPIIKSRRVVAGTFVAGIMTSTAGISMNFLKDRNFIIKWFGERTMTQSMANYLAKDNWYLIHIPMRLRTIAIWKQFHKLYSMAGLTGLYIDGKAFNEIVGNDYTFVAQNNCKINSLFENRTCNCKECSITKNHWGIRFTHVEQLKWMGVVPIEQNVTDWVFNNYEFMWKIAIPDDARVYVGCSYGPSHEHWYHCSCERELRTNKVVFLEKCRNEHYQPRHDHSPVDYLASGTVDVNSGG